MESGSSLVVWVTWIMGALPILWLLVNWWNEIVYVLPIKLRSKKGEGKLPPGSMGVPYFGQMFTFLWYFKFLRRPDDFINSKRNKFGDGIGVYRTHLFGSPSIIATAPDVIKFVFLSSDEFPLRWPTVDIFGAHSLVTLHGKPYQRIRKLVTTAVNNPRALQRIVAQIQPRIVSGLESWAEKGRVVVYHEARKVTFENIGRLFASINPGPLLDEMNLMFGGIVRGVRANPINFPGTAYRHALQCKKRLVDIFKTELEKKKTRTVDIEAEYDLMDGLMKNQDENGNKLCDEEIIDNIVGFILAGFQSTTISSMWAVYFLAKFPHVLERLREENIALSKKKNGELITFEDVSSLIYTKKVVEEVIRMANVAAFVFRRITKDVEYKGYKLPKGWQVILWLRYVHTNPENFDDPLSFNPDRWDKPAKPWTFLVFGGGARICAASTLARLQIAVLLHHLTVSYKWELVNPDAKVVYQPYPSPSDYVEVSFSRLS
ncbi:unnamed protein product [Rhodiola kirilowii]